MKVWQIDGGFGLDALRLSTRKEAAIGVSDVRVDVYAASLNRRDLMTVEGQYNPRQPLPLIPLSDGAGVVTEVGAGVTHLQVGDRVVSQFCPLWQDGAPSHDVIRHTLGGPVDGMLRESVVLPADGVARFPAHLSLREAATLPCAALTAWSALVEVGQLAPGQTVLTLGTGGVSLFAVQFAKMCGARVIATTSTAEKAARLLALGADEVVLYPELPSWGKSVRAYTEGRGVDHVVEVGGSGTLGESLRAVAVGGTISLIGVLAGGSPPALTPALMNQVRIQGVFVGSRGGFARMCRAIDTHQLRPVVDEVFDFAGAPEAFARMKQGAHFGKIAVEMRSE